MAEDFQYRYFSTLLNRTTKNLLLKASFSGWPEMETFLREVAGCLSTNQTPCFDHFSQMVSLRVSFFDFSPALISACSLLLTCVLPSPFSLSWQGYSPRSLSPPCGAPSGLVSGPHALTNLFLSHQKGHLVTTYKLLDTPPPPQEDESALYFTVDLWLK